MVHVRNAKSGYDVLNARSGEIEIILLDIVMPDIDGIECLSWIEGNKLFQHIPVYMLSGLDDSLLRAASVEKGAVDMILKPLTPAKIRKMIKEQNIELILPDTFEQTLGNPLKSHTPLQPTPKDVQVTLPLGRGSAPAFKLCDSDWNPYSFPADSVMENTLIVFIPTVFYAPLYDQSGIRDTTTPKETSASTPIHSKVSLPIEPPSPVGFMNHLVDQFEQLSGSVNMIVISGDLPFALQAAKERFNLPFKLLSDPSLAVAKEFVGTVDVGDLVARADFDSLHEYDHLTNRPEAGDKNNPKKEPTSRKGRRISVVSASSAGTSSTEVKKPAAAAVYQSNALRSAMGSNLGLLLVNRQRDVLKKTIVELDCHGRRWDLHLIHS